MSGGDRKQNYFSKLNKLLEDYNKVLIVGADNVGSHHMQTIRKSLRGRAVLLMGKNTMVRKAIRGIAESNPKLQTLLPYIKFNVGLLFCKEDLSGIKKTVSELRVAAPAKVGAICPNDVIVPAGPTGMEPTQTSFLQALNIPSKIVKGQVDILNDVKILQKGQKVGQSESSLLAKLNIKPFSYGLSILTVYDEGSIYDVAVLDMSDADIVAKFSAGVGKVAALSLGIGYPTVAALPHVLIRGYKNLLSISVTTDYSFPRADKVKQMLANPGAFAAASTPAVTASSGKDTAAKDEPKPKAPEPEEEDTDMGLSLFD
jgi:large subunit ribosomal protein LP0